MPRAPGDAPDTTAATPSDATEPDAIKDMLSEEEPLALPSVTPDREAVFREAVTAFARKE